MKLAMFKQFTTTQNLSVGDSLNLISDAEKESELLARRVVRELEGVAGEKHLDEYADARTERGQCMLKTICEQLGFHSLGYQTVEGVLESIGIDKDKVCTYCWTGKE